MAYTTACEIADITPVATPKVNGKDYYNGYIITRADSGINSISDLEGKHFGYVDKGSASGYLYARYSIQQDGHDPVSYTHLKSKTRIVLMDEPSMGLSPIFVEEIFNIIKEISAEGTTVLLVEQNSKKALAIADRAYVLETGKIVLEGDAKDLLNDESIKKEMCIRDRQ